MRQPAANWPTPIGVLARKTPGAYSTIARVIFRRGVRRDATCIQGHQWGGPASGGRPRRNIINWAMSEQDHHRHTPKRSPGPSSGRRRYNGLAGPSRVRRRRRLADDGGDQPAAPAPTTAATASCPRRPGNRRGSSSEKETPTVVLTEKTDACVSCPASSSPYYILRERNGMTPTRPSRESAGRGHGDHRGPATGWTARKPGRASSEPPSSQESDATTPPRPLAEEVRGEQEEMTVHHRRRGEEAAGGTQASSAASGPGNPFGDTQVSYRRAYSCPPPVAGISPVLEGAL